MASKKENGKPNLKHWLVNKLRRISYQWPPRKEAIKKGRVERGKYRCNICEGIFGPKEIQLDHIIPVIDEEDGFQNWDTYLDRLFCDSEGFQVLCKSCHKYKSEFENIVRRQAKNDKAGNRGDL